MLKVYNRRSIIFICLLIILSLVGIFLIIAVSSNWGIGFNPDSVAYVAAARNLLNGNGITVLYNDDGTIPLNLWAPQSSNETIHVMLWPPLYPIFLSFGGLLGIDIIVFSRWLSALLFGTNILLISYIIKKITRSIWLSIFCAIVMITSVVVLGIHLMAWSEPLFIFLGYLGLYLLINYLKEKNKLLFYIAAVLLSLAFLTRYAGLTFIISCTLAILFLNDERIRKRIIDAAILMALSCIPTGIWILRTIYVRGVQSFRSFIFHPVLLINVKTTISNISKWLLPEVIPGKIRVTITGIFLILVITFFVILIRKLKQKNIDSIQKLSIKFILLNTIFIVVYLSFIVFSKSFLDFHIPIRDFRILSPVFISTLIIVIYFLKLLLIYFDYNRLVKIVVSLVCVIFIGFYIVNCINLARPIYNNGKGYEGRDWKLSETMKELEKYPESIMIYSNGPDAIYLLTGRTAKMLPLVENPYTLEKNDTYYLQMELMEKGIKEKEGIIVFFDKITRLYLPTEDRLKEELNLRPLVEKTDGTIYGSN